MSYKLEAFVVAKRVDAQLGDYIKIHLYQRHDKQSPTSQQQLHGCTHELIDTPCTRSGRGLTAMLRKMLRALLSDTDILKRKFKQSTALLCQVKSSLNTFFLNLVAIMQEMSCIKELYLSANTLQSKFNI